MNPLDNMVWHSLFGEHSMFREGSIDACRYDGDVSIFCALPDEARSEHWDALRALVGPGETASLFRSPVEIPDGWDIVMDMRGVQMIGPTTPASIDPSVEILGIDSAAEIAELVERTKPGPFRPRTPELGTFVGIRDEGELVALAGQRLRADAFVEISAVCTDERFRGKGLASTLMHAQHALLAADGRRPILHTSADNVRAISLYESLGYTHRRDVQIAVLRAPL